MKNCSMEELTKQELNEIYGGSDIKFVIVIINGVPQRILCH